VTFGGKWQEIFGRYLASYWGGITAADARSPARLQCPVKRGPADLQVPGNGGDRLAARLPGASDGQHILIDGSRAAATPALGLGGAQPVQRTSEPLTCSLEFTQHRCRCRVKRQQFGGCQVMTDTARVIDSGFAVLDSPSADAGLAAPQPQAHGGEMGPVALRGSPPRHAEFPRNGKSGICGLPPCCSGKPCASRDLRRRPAVAVAECYRQVISASLLQTPVVAGPTSWW